MLEGDTIAAIATAPGSGGVAIIRVSGTDAFAIASEIFRRRGGTGVPLSRRIYVGRIYNIGGNEMLDEVIAFGMRAPQSYTGEDVVEIQCHGGSLVSQRILQRVLAAGARPAQPGEFTKRAFLNGRMDLAQAEAVADLIGARSEAARQLASSQLQGTLSSRVESLRGVLLQARAVCEVSLDFPDEEVPEVDDGSIAERVKAVREDLEALAATFDRGQLRYGGTRVALVGRPNVGKSSLLNALVGRDRALVTPIAGTTRDVIEAQMVLGGVPVMLMDTAGIRSANDLVESMGIARSHGAAVDAKAIVAVFDGSVPLQPEDAQVADLVRRRPCVAAVNKQDRDQNLTDEDVKTLLGDVRIVGVSAATGAGMQTLGDAISELILGAEADGRDDEVMIYRVRHRDEVGRAIDDLARAEKALCEHAPLELVATDLAAAATALSGIVGHITTEDVLDRVFAEFCLGK